MPRVEIPLIGPSYTNREKPLSAQVAKNLWPEINPEARNQVALHNVAGIRTFATLSGIDRGMTDFNNLLYVVNGTTLYSVDDAGTNYALGTIAGSERCVMANDSLQLIIVSAGTAYKYTVAGGVEEITDPDLVNPTTVAYLNNQFIFDQNNGVWGEFVTSSVDPDLSIDALDFAQAESHPDDIIAIVSFRQLVYFFGSHSVEPWQNTGVGNPPFARINSGVQPYGLAGLHAITKTNEYMYFLYTRRIPRRSNGLNFLNVGNPALGVEFAKYSKIDDCICFEFVQDNQQFVAFTFPTANRTWVFHEPSGSWFQLTSGIGNDRHRASSMIHMYGLNYCADHTNGLLYEYSLDIYSDNGEPIINLRDTAVIHGGLFGVPGKKLFFDEVEFIIVAGQTEVEGTGLGPQPENELSGLCGFVSSLTQGQLLAPTLIQNMTDSAHSISQLYPVTAGVGFDDTEVFSFTCAFSRETPPVQFTNATLMEVDGADPKEPLKIYMDTNGYIRILAENSAGTTILDVTIRNNGGSFADSSVYMIALVIDLSGSREVYIDNADRTNDTSWVTWTTYTDDIINLSADEGYYFGTSSSGEIYGDESGTDIEAWEANLNNVGMLSFDDQCSLIPLAVWDNDGNITDPQKWEGWYLQQPQCFYGPGLHRNTGKTEPATYDANDMEKANDSTVDRYIFESGLSGGTANQQAYTYINGSMADTITANPKSGDGLTTVPPPDPDPTVEIVAPFWENTGNWIDLSKLTNTTFESMFGVAIELADFNSVFAVNKAALVNTGDAGIAAATCWMK